MVSYTYFLNILSLTTFVVNYIKIIIKKTYVIIFVSCHNFIIITSLTLRKHSKYNILWVELTSAQNFWHLFWLLRQENDMCLVCRACAVVELCLGWQVAPSPSSALRPINRCWLLPSSWMVEFVLFALRWVQLVPLGKQVANYVLQDNNIMSKLVARLPD